MDLTDSNLTKNQYLFLDEQRSINPIFRIDQNHWMLLDYSDVKTHLKNPIFLRQIEESREDVVHSILDMDFEEHWKYRKILNPFFSSSSVKKIQQVISSRIENIFFSLKSQNKLDIVNNIGFKIPFFTICDILGIELDDSFDYSFIKKWTIETMAITNIVVSKESYRTYLEGSYKLGNYLIALLYGSKHKKNKDGLFYYLKSIDLDGEKIKDDQIISICLLLFIAGFETNLNSLTTIIHQMVLDNTLREEYMSKNRSTKNIEELLRYSSSVNFVTRKASTDVDIDGNIIKKGEKILLHIGAANRDPKIFEDPHTINLDRHNSDKHLSFGSGPHYCIGASLSKMQIEATIYQFFSTFKNIEPIGFPVKNPNYAINGFSSFEVSFS